MYKSLTAVKLVLVCVTALAGIYYFFLQRRTVTIPKEVKGMRHPGAFTKDQTSFSLAPLEISAKSGKVKGLKQGDVVAYQLPGKPIVVRAARVIATAGQRVSIAGGQVQVNGKRYPGPSGVRALRGMELPEILVPRDCVYLLADVRGSEQDSWKKGPVPIHHVLGTIE